MKKYHVEFDIEVKKFKESSLPDGIDPAEVEVPMTQEEITNLEHALNVEVESLREMDFDLDITVNNIDIGEVDDSNHLGRSELDPDSLEYRHWDTLSDEAKAAYLRLAREENKT